MQQFKSVNNKTFFAHLTLIRVVCQPLLKEGLVGVLVLPPSTVGYLNSIHQCPAFGTVIFCTETVPKAGH